MHEIDEYQVTYQKPLSSELLPLLLKMTPLTWNIEEPVELDITEVTVDLDVLVGKGE